MNVFDLRNRLIEDYASYISSFITIRDQRINQYVEDSLKRGLLWPDPLIQMSPAFEPGKTIDELVQEGLLHPECNRIFRTQKDKDGTGNSLRLHKHQEDAIRVAQTGASYVLTTGTGSGKSLAYIVPIVDYVLQNGPGKGIQAIIVYPMNALANSQMGELEKFINLGYPNKKGPVTFKRYTGQEKDEEKIAIIANPPDILLTNFVMLELILTRPGEKKLVRASRDLQFLVLDELHTYRGRQGADVALLARRVQEATSAKNLQYVGTSATVAGGGTLEEQQKQVASIASTLFGVEVKPENVIGETLRRSTPDRPLDDPEFISELTKRLSDESRKPPEDYDSFSTDPLSIWLETTFGVTTDQSGRLVRTSPKTLTGDQGAANLLTEGTGFSKTRAAKTIEEGLLSSYRCQPNPDSGFAPFAFRLHQFISRGDTVYASLEPEESRYVTVHGQQFVPGDRSKILLPLVFCRECGQEYYCVRFVKPDGDQNYYEIRELSDQARDHASEAGFLYFSSTNPWPDDSGQIQDRLPDDWLEEHDGRISIRSNRRKHLPRTRNILPDGIEGPDGLTCQYISAPFRFCLNCGVSYDFRQRSDYGKLSSLGLGGRSTATTLLSLSTIRNLTMSEFDLPEKAKKLLSFTDNRQDASLQAGHFNDFIEIGILRAGLYRAALEAGESGLSHDELTQKVFAALKLPFELYAQDPTDNRFQGRRNTDEAFKNLLGYRLYRDLRRGWRVTSPNLEQCGLLEIKYGSLEELSQAEDIWQNCHSALAQAKPETRAKVAEVLLDYMRRELAIGVNYLDADFQERLQQQSDQRLKEPWSLDESEKMETSRILLPRSQRRGDHRGFLYLSPRGGFGLYLRRPGTFEDYPDKIKLKETETIIVELLSALQQAGLVRVQLEPRDEDDVPGYQLLADGMQWVVGDGTKGFHDPIRMPDLPEEGIRTNTFFVDFYRNVAGELKGIEAREHTAQVPYEIREEREERFREARLPILYCSPTMELGVDISELNVVNMRNVPPTPANYAQRSGRAGRSGQPALVFTYCSTGSPHDQYFFKRPEHMAMGAVTPPRLELANEDLVRAHIQAIWLAETGVSLGTSLRDILDLSGELPSMKLLDSVQNDINSPTARSRALERASRVLSSIEDHLRGVDWYTNDWLDTVISRAPLTFDSACNRWRSLYQAARSQRDRQHGIIGDASRSHHERKRARGLRSEAESQLELLTQGQNIIQSDFYSYRYFASEGFLAGYSFPRLPLSAYIPARRRRTGQDEFLSRPRFLAISEFGPRAFVYHEGSRYIINKVILPIQEEERDFTTNRAKQCHTCGYLHPMLDDEGLDLCERCGATLDIPLSQLFRLQNVSTRRRDNISCDEDERLRLGYDIRTGIRFALIDGRLSCREGIVQNGDSPIARISYGHAATLWRINLGWLRRENRQQLGFVLDIDNGYWQRDPQAIEDDRDDPYGQHTLRVIPFVEDRKNSLLFKPSQKLDENVMASLQAAIKNALQVVYQLEDRELAAEPLPHRDTRNLLLFYESAEGGAGVLRHLLDDPKALSNVARKALELCHFDADTGDDLKRAPRATEDCEAACYDCLLSYVNQRDHKLLDRKMIRDLLLQLRDATVQASPTDTSPAEHYQQLLNLTDSALERNWLKYVHDKGYRLPSKAQHLIEACQTRPDFLYENCMTVVYVDGPHHEYPERQQRDAEQMECLADTGFTVIRFGHKDDWESIISNYPHIFGKQS
ncbi:DEAD/DEAH box helicase [Acidobacteria bacterium AH-259-L09]|nr:DEAD/DEAH box helicase [Acidobacteria bacterium AH-259-L09]